jgi:hypothetical protein
MHVSFVHAASVLCGACPIVAVRAVGATKVLRGLLLRVCAFRVAIVVDVVLRSVHVRDAIVTVAEVLGGASVSIASIASASRAIFRCGLRDGIGAIGIVVSTVLRVHVDVGCRSVQQGGGGLQLFLRGIVVVLLGLAALEGASGSGRRCRGSRD